MPSYIWRVLSQNALSAIFDIFIVRAPSYNTKLYLSNDTLLIIYKGIFLKLWSKVLQIFLLFSLYFSSLNLKYLKLTKMDITRFAMKLFICFIPISIGWLTNACEIEILINTNVPRWTWIISTSISIWIGKTFIMKLDWNSMNSTLSQINHTFYLNWNSRVTHTSNNNFVILFEHVWFYTNMVLCVNKTFAIFQL